MGIVMAGAMLLWLLLVGSVWGQMQSILEQQSLRTYPAGDFQRLGEYMSQHIGHTLSHNQDVRTLELTETEMSPLHVAEPLATHMDLSENTICYNYPSQAFSFDMIYSFTYTLLVVPLSGSCTLRFTATNSTYTLSAKDSAIIPILVTQWQVQVLNISGALASLLGAREMIERVGTKMNAAYYNTVIANCMASRIRSYYASYFGDQITYIDYPFVKHYQVRLKSTFTRLNITSEGLSVVYNQMVTPDIQPTIPQDANVVLRKVFIDFQAVATILTNAASAAQNVRLRNEDIAPSSRFRLDLPGLLHIFPELLMELGPDHSVYAEVDGWETKLVAIPDETNNQVTFAPLNLTLRLYVDNEITQILQTTFQVLATFSPILVCDKKNQAIVFLNLGWVKGDVVVSAFETPWHSEGLFNKLGIASLIQSAIENWVVKYHAATGLGAGLKISTIYPVNLSSSKARVSANGFQITLNTTGR